MAEAERGRFVWYDLMTTDPEGAKEFYPRFTGWGRQDWQGPEGMPPYTMWSVGDQPIGGVGDLPEEARDEGALPHWISYVAVPDVDETTERAAELGGRVLKEPMEIPTVGRFSVVADPQGAVIALFTPSEDAPGNPGDPRPGDFSWHELATSDYEGAFDFYSQLFGWEKGEAMEMGEGWIYQLFTREGRQLGGIFNKPAEMPGPPGWLYYVLVPDLDAALERVKQGGGEVLHGPQEVPGGDLIAQCLDPQGAIFALHSRPAVH